jgi:hypothetical protein
MVEIHHLQASLLVLTYIYLNAMLVICDHLCGLVGRVPVWNRVRSALVRINEELLERKVVAPV